MTTILSSLLVAVHPRMFAATAAYTAGCGAALPWQTLDQAEGSR